MADSAHSPEATDHNTTSTTQAHTEHGHGDHGPVNPMEISGQMVVWTWILFAAMLLVLYKLAWKPILGALEQREKDIQDSIDHAREIAEEREGIGAERTAIIHAADEKAKSVLEKARMGARESAAVIEAKAREEAQILSENAAREIETARAKAEASLKQDSAGWARELAGRLIDANLDDKKNKALTDKLIKEL